MGGRQALRGPAALKAPEAPPFQTANWKPISGSSPFEQTRESDAESQLFSSVRARLKLEMTMKYPDLEVGAETYIEC